MTDSALFYSYNIHIVFIIYSFLVSAFCDKVDTRTACNRALQAMGHGLHFLTTIRTGVLPYLVFITHTNQIQYRNPKFTLNPFGIPFGETPTTNPNS